jgi:hypothetical protein
MKIRLDYVSNSSSSSFFIVGATFENEEILEALEKHGLDVDECFDFEYGNDAEMLKKRFGLEAEHGFEDSDYDYCFGLHFDSMKDDETKAQFLQRISDNLEKLFGRKCKVDAICDEGYC